MLGAMQRFVYMEGELMALKFSGNGGTALEKGAWA
jgi:hypothetical protein